jgi:hypothetical protein
MLQILSSSPKTEISNMLFLLGLSIDYLGVITNGFLQWLMSRILRQSGKIAKVKQP